MSPGCPLHIFCLLSSPWLRGDLLHGHVLRRLPLLLLHLPHELREVGADLVQVVASGLLLVTGDNFFISRSPTRALKASEDSDLKALQHGHQLLWRGIFGWEVGHRHVGDVNNASD